MKRFLILASAMLLVLGMVGTASAAPYEYSDLIDDWGYLGWDSTLITSGVKTYTHILGDGDDGYTQGDTILDATLQLDFTNDSADGHWTWTWSWSQWNFVRDEWVVSQSDLENLSVSLDDGTWTSWGEVDNDQYEGDVLVSLLDDGMLKVELSLLCGQDAWLDHSKLYGTAEAPVPEPATMLLLGVGLVGLAAVGRKKLIQK